LLLIYQKTLLHRLGAIFFESPISNYSKIILAVPKDLKHDIIYRLMYFGIFIIPEKSIRYIFLASSK